MQCGELRWKSKVKPLSLPAADRESVATAVLLAAEGAAVLAADLAKAGARETVGLIESAGGRHAVIDTASMAEALLPTG